MRYRFILVLPALAALAACSSGSGPADVVNGTSGGGQYDRTGDAPTSSAPHGTVLDGPGGRAAVAAELQQAVGDRIYFLSDQSSISPEARLVLERQAAFMKRYPPLLFTIEGHADERGTREYNLALGDRRARAVQETLVALGIPAARLTVISYGKERPAVAGDTEAAWAQNRRAVTVIQ